MTGAGVLATKLVVTPALIGAASLAGRRWGPAVGGWLVGLPFTSAPVTFFVALASGLAFAAAAAAGILAGTMSQAAFCLAYGWLAGRGPLAAAAAGCLAFAAATAALEHAGPPPAALFLAVVAALAAALRLMPAARPDRPGAAARPPAWDLPARMALATALVLAITGAAPALGPRLTGLLTPFPLFGAILAVFAHRQAGPDAAVRVLRGLLAGLFAFAAFFLAIALLIERAGIAGAFAAAVTAALAVQGVALWELRRHPG